MLALAFKQLSPQVTVLFLQEINFKVSEGLFRVGKAVLDEFQQGNFGTLVVGRRGMNRKFFTGSTSRYLINGFTEGALWVVP